MNERHRAEDERARTAALDPSRSFIVQAPAGSGKTELLTQRYLVLLARVDHPEEILAVTFTNKAAAEMRDRVLRALARGRDPSPPPAEHQRRTWELARAVLERDAKAGWQLEQNPRRLRVQTIDALCAALARQLPLAAGFGALPSTVEDAHDHYREAARETLALVESGTRWTEATARLLRHLDNDLGRIEGLLAQMLARRDQWLRHVTGGRDNPRLERAVLERALANVVRDALAAVAEVAPAAEAAEIAALACYAAANLRRAGIEAPLCACVGLTGWPGTAPGDLEAWRGIAQLLLTDQGEWRAQVNKRLGFPAASGGTTCAEQDAFACAKQRWQRLRERLAGQDVFRRRLHALRALPTPRYREEQWAVLEALTELLPVAAAQLKLVFRARGEVDFLAVAHGALEALGPAEEPSELALKLDYRLRHILVDEFQDTSLSQYQLLERLTAGWEPNDGRTLFLVGDPMQSIYRFREAEVGLYLRARRAGIGGLELTPLTLAVNFRSQAALVDWINDAFARVLPPAEDLSLGAVPYTPSEAAQPALADGPAVRVHAFFDDDGVAEARRVVELVAAARAEDPAGRIAILVRARSHLAEIVPQLRAAGIRFVALDIEPLGYRQAVQDLVALTRALEHPGDRLAWLAVLRAPWCGLVLADLQQLAADPERSVWEAMNDPRCVARLSSDGQVRLARVIEPIACALQERRRRPLARAVEGLWLALGGPACALAPADLDDAEAYFALLERIETAGGLTDFARLAEELTRLYAVASAGTDPAAVQIMTIHKAKGLEFDTVIVPGLGRAPPRTESPLLLWAERARASAPAADLLLAPIRAAGAHQDPIYAWLKQLDAERGRFEDGRLLYVAATRAKKRLHLLGHVSRDALGQVRAPAAGSLLHTLWPAVRGIFEQAAASAPPPLAPQPPEAPRTPPPGLRRLARNWRLPAPPPAVEGAPAPAATAAAEPALEFDWAGETVRHIGTVVHRYLLRIAREGLAHWDAARIGNLHEAFVRQLARLGVARHECEAAARRVAQALCNTLADARGRWLLDERHTEAHSEYALSGVLGAQVVNVTLDRSFVDAHGTRWIVDYKTSVHEGAGLDEFLDRERVRYAPQLERYAAILRGLDDRRPIRLGLYFPLLGGWREWEYNDGEGRGTRETEIERKDGRLEGSLPG